MKIPIVIILANFFTNGLMAQVEACYCFDSINAMEHNLLGIEWQANDAKVENGACYYYWGSGNVVLLNGKKIAVKLMRYDGDSDELIVQHNAVNKMAIDRNTIKGFEYLDSRKNEMHLFMRKQVKAAFESDIKDVYLQVLVSPNISLYAYRKLKVAQTSSTMEPDYGYFIEPADGKIYQLFKLSRRSLLNLFPEQYSMLKKLLKDHQNRVNTEEKLIAAIKLFNSTITSIK